MKEMQEVKEQYDKNPYPKVSWLAQIKPEGVIHASYEAGAALVHRSFHSHRDKNIALLGCGTMEPAAFAVAHPHGRITAVDFSPQSIRQARRYCLFHLKSNVHFQAQDLIAFCRANTGVFDYVHCYGVLHHLQNPSEGFAGLRGLLKKDGFARIMVYSRSQRQRLQQIQNLAKLLDIKNPSELNDVMRGLPQGHPLRLGFEMHPEKNNRSGFVDAFLHACEHSFSLKQVEEILATNGLYLHAWDFSQNLKGLLNQAEGATEREKILWLEASGQWPAPFTFWVGPSPKTVAADESFIIKNPLTRWRFKSRLHSTLLKKFLSLTKAHRQCLLHCENGPQPKDSFPPSWQTALNELVQGRFLLEVQQ